VLVIVGIAKNVETHKVGAPASTKVQHLLRLENNRQCLYSLNMAMTTIKSFGCSFIHGSDLLDGNDLDYSRFTWPALMAKQLNFEYNCYAQPGQGNFKIYCDILANSFKNDHSIYVINWTWIDRFDYVNQLEQWDTLRPAEDNHLKKFYYQNLHSQLSDMISNSCYIVSAAEHLTSLNCPYIMTYMDHNLLTPLNPNWHDPKYLEVLQQKLQKILTNFDGQNFLDWSRHHNFLISDAWHPLEDAHQAAAEYWLPAVKQLL
jgi:hypothetical protein